MDPERTEILGFKGPFKETSPFDPTNQWNGPWVRTGDLEGDVDKWIKCRSVNSLGTQLQSQHLYH